MYASSSLSLAALEYLVHLDPDVAPADLIAMTVEVPEDASIERLEVGRLPDGWQHQPEPAACKDIGDEWVASRRSLALVVPSAPVPEEANVLLNPRHPEARLIRVVAERPFQFDPRLSG